MSSLSFTVVGMTCGGCVASVDRALRDLPGVTAVRVDLATGRVTVEGNPPPSTERVQRAIDDLGYALGGDGPA